jgi:hypothetical protein
MGSPGREVRPFPVYGMGLGREQSLSPLLTMDYQRKSFGFSGAAIVYPSEDLLSTKYNMASESRHSATRVYDLLNLQEVYYIAPSRFLKQVGLFR